MAKKKPSHTSIIPLLAAVLAVAAADWYIAHHNFIANMDCFQKNDFEITQYKHPEKVWDKVFFGNSVVISSFIEEQSTSGYINLGLDYGVVTDLREMIEKEYIKLGSDLVVGLNYLTLYDEFETNPTYIWHKKAYEPYAYFERDRFYPILTDGFDKLLRLEDCRPMKYGEQTKSVYHGMVADTAMQEKLKEYEDEYFNLPLEKFSENTAALGDVVSYCLKHGIRMRVVWMPWNPKYEKPQLLTDLKTEVNQVLEQNNIEILDLEDSLPETYFYDTGHLNYEVGSPQFTSILDQWL